MVKQYSKYYIKEVDQHVNGVNTQDENIADNGGVTLAYRAYRRAHSGGTEQSLPGLNYTGEQLFWISYGLENCEMMTNEVLKLTLQMDSHSPGRYRLNGVVSNSPDFARDFQCPVSAPMNPEVKCRVW